MRRGFTLVELLVVLFILAIFVLIIFVIATNTTTVAAPTEKQFDAVVGTFNGHSYVHFTSYPMTHTVLHDPDCPCRLKAERE